MTYNNKFVAVVKCNGKILVEKNGIVHIPFGSEYTILLKNLNSVKAVVDITIDGQDILDSNRLIVHPNSSNELKGFMKDNRVTNKFKFIQKTEEISDFRGDNIDDGIIRIEITFETSLIPNWGYYTYNQNYTSPISKSAVSYRFTSEGITVKGDNNVNQSFAPGFTNPLEYSSSVIILILRGIREDNTKVSNLISVKNKVFCETCGTRNLPKNKFCYNCGTCLI